MNETSYNEKSFSTDVIFAKDVIKDMINSIHDYCPRDYHIFLTTLHKAYDCMTLIQFYLKHISNNN